MKPVRRRGVASVLVLTSCVMSFMAFRSVPPGHGAERSAAAPAQAQGAHPATSLPSDPAGQVTAQASDLSDAAYHEALALLSASGQDLDVGKARSLLAPYAGVGDPRALNLMGLTYDPLWGASRESSPEEAAHYYRQAAAQGYDAAAHNLGRLFGKGLITAEQATVPRGRFQTTAAPTPIPGSATMPTSNTNEVSDGPTTRSAPAPVARMASNTETDGRTIFARVAPAVVELRSQDNYGSGVIVGILRSGESGLKWEGATETREVGFAQSRSPVDVLRRGTSFLLIVTNAHVVERSAHLRVGLGVKGEGESLYQLAASALCLSQNPQEDLAFVLVAADTISEEALASVTYLSPFASETPPPKGTVVYALGNPEGLTRTITQGLYNGLRPEGIQFDAPISVGSSGGALVDGNGNLLGITSGFVASKDSQNLNFALPAARILQNLSLGQSACRPL